MTAHALLATERKRLTKLARRPSSHSTSHQSRLRIQHPTSRANIACFEYSVHRSSHQTIQYHQLFIESGGRPQARAGRGCRGVVVVDSPKSPLRGRETRRQYRRASPPPQRFQDNLAPCKAP